MERPGSKGERSDAVESTEARNPSPRDADISQMSLLHTTKIWADWVPLNPIPTIRTESPTLLLCAPVLGAVGDSLTAHSIHGVFHPTLYSVLSTPYEQDLAYCAETSRLVSHTRSLIVRVVDPRYSL